MQPRRARRLPFQGDLQRVVGEDRLLVVVALIKPYAMPVPQVDGRYDLDLIGSYRQILEYLRQGRARNARLSLFLFSARSRARLMTFLVSLGMMTSSV